MNQKSSSRSALEDRASLPGAWHANGEESAASGLGGDDSAKASDDQMMEIARMRLDQKRRLADQEPDPGPPTDQREAPIDDLQNSMGMLQNDVSTREREHQEEEQEKRYSLRFWGIIAAILLLTAGAIVGIIIGLGGEREGSNTIIAPTPDNVSRPLVHTSPCALGNADSMMSERYLSLRSIILSDAPSMQVPIDSPASTARVALCWLADYDTLGGMESGNAYDVIQRFTLAVIFYHFVGTDMTMDNELIDKDWLLEGTHECFWDGLTCLSPDTGASLASKRRVVTAIDLSRARLETAIPTELVLLTNLQHLYIADNLLSGTIVPMTTLETLVLGTNLINGSLQVLEQMDKLRVFQANSNRIEGELPAIGNLTHLEKFELESMNIGGTLPEDMSALTNLSVLNLISLVVTGTIPSALASLSNLEILALPSNVLSGAIPSEIGILSNLEKLRLGGNKLSSSLPTELGQLTSLAHISLLGLFLLTGTIPSELGSGLSVLEYVDVGQCPGLSGTIPIGLCELQEKGKLTTLTAHCGMGCSTNCCTGCLGRSYHLADCADCDMGD